MAKVNASARMSSQKSDFLKKLSGGKILCSEVNKAASNAKFLHMRRHDAYVGQLESARQSMLVENGRAQKDMRRQLDKYKKRKQSIFRERVLSQQSDSDDDDDDNLDGCARRSHPSATTLSSRLGRRKSSSYSVSLVPPSGSSNSSGMFPAILKVPMVASEDENIHTAIQRQLQQHMQRQESLHFQILRSRVHDFCSDLENAQGVRGFYITTSSARRIIFSEVTDGRESPQEVPPQSAKARRRGSAIKSSLKTSLPALTVPG